jgi:hypothetical protein
MLDRAAYAGPEGEVLSGPSSDRTGRGTRTAETDALAVSILDLTVALVDRRRIRLAEPNGDPKPAFAAYQVHAAY